MASSERRRAECPRLAALKHELNADQLETLRQLEMFGWELKFVRRPPFQEPTPVVVDGDRHSFAVIRGDGSLDSNPSLELRH